MKVEQTKEHEWLRRFVGEWTYEALHTTDEGFRALVWDMGDAPLTQPTPGAPGGGGNHPMWCVGVQQR